MKESILSGYLWGFDKPEAADVAFRQFKKFYPDGDLHFTLDLGGKETEFKQVCDKWNVSMKVNPINVGRCGWMTHYEKYVEDGPQNELGRKCWPKENAFIWVDRLYEVAKNCNSKYLISMEDDTFILKPISILEEEFGIAVCEYNTNVLPNYILKFIENIGGSSDIPTNIFGNKGYGAMGGFIINTDQFVKGWDYLRPILDEKWDEILTHTHLIGWVDVLPQLTIMAIGGKVVMNRQLIQTWYHERKDLYPTYTHWKDYEIADFVKNIEDIRSI